MIYVTHYVASIEPTPTLALPRQGGGACCIWLTPAASVTDIRYRWQAHYANKLSPRDSPRPRTECLLLSRTSYVILQLQLSVTSVRVTSSVFSTFLGLISGIAGSLGICAYGLCAVCTCSNTTSLLKTGLFHPSSLSD
jgi:hypothetical protein